MTIFQRISSQSLNSLALVPVHVKPKSKRESKIWAKSYGDFTMLHLCYFRRKREFQIKVNFDFADPESFGVYSLNLWNGENPISLTHHLVEDMREQDKE